MSRTDFDDKERFQRNGILALLRGGNLPSGRSDREWCIMDMVTILGKAFDKIEREN